MRGARGDVKLVGLVGAESTGKSTIALMLAGRLRTHGIKAELVVEAGSRRPFAPELLDTLDAAHVYAVAQAFAGQAHAVLRPNVDVVVCDRTPLDLVAYHAVKLRSIMSTAMLVAAREWVARFDQLYFLRVDDGAPYVEDGHRAPQHLNSWRSEVDAWLCDALSTMRVPCEMVGGPLRGRAEYIYHHALHTLLGKSRPLRAYEQVRSWLSSRGWRVVEVRPQGSNSVTRFHPASDSDDVDAIVVVDGGADYAVEVRDDIEMHKVQLENIVQASLDLLVTPVGMEAHEA